MKQMTMRLPLVFLSIFCLQFGHAPAFAHAEVADGMVAAGVEVAEWASTWRTNWL